jgi:hypothetical protein
MNLPPIQVLLREEIYIEMFYLKPLSIPRDLGQELTLSTQRIFGLGWTS